MYKSDRGGKFGGGKKFGGNKFGKRNFGGDRGFRDGGRPKMHKAVCDECGRPCEVPFKPSGERPVYCNNCFQKGDGHPDKSPRGDNRGRGASKPNGITQEQFEILNSKLDEILAALTGIAEEDDEDEEA